MMMVLFLFAKGKETNKKRVGAKIRNKKK